MLRAFVLESLVDGATAGADESARERSAHELITLCPAHYRALRRGRLEVSIVSAALDLTAAGREPTPGLPKLAFRTRWSFDTPEIIEESQHRRGPGLPLAVALRVARLRMRRRKPPGVAVPA